MYHLPPLDPIPKLVEYSWILEYETLELSDIQLDHGCVGLRFRHHHSAVTATFNLETTH